MQPIQRAIKALQDLHAADPGTINSLLQGNASINESAAALMGLPQLPAGRVLSTFGLISHILKAAIGDSLIHIRSNPGLSLHAANPATVVEDFDASQGWEDIEDPIDYCSRQPDPSAAASMLVEANLAMDESGWAAAFLQACPDVWHKPTTHILQEATRLLTDLKPAWGSGGYLWITVHGVEFRFSEIRNADSADYGKIGYNFQLNRGDGRTKTLTDLTRSVSPTLSCARIADFIRHEIKAVLAEQDVERRYRAIPLIVYVPKGLNWDVDSDRALLKLREDTGIRAFLAEDFEIGEATENPDNELSAEITAACKPSPPTK